MLRKSLTVLGLGLGIFAASPIASAAIVTVDPDGGAAANAAVSVGSIDFLPGNALNKNALISPLLFGNMYQARVGSLLDANGGVIQIVGLNDATSASKFELTIVAQFDLQASYFYDQFNNLTTTTTLAPQQTTNYFQVYYDSKMNANDLTGVGFNDGTLIMSGYAKFFGGSFVEFAMFPPTNLDQFGSNDWAGTLSNTGVGGSSVNAAVTYINPAFFQSGILEMNFSTTNSEPYNQINPSQTFINGVPANIGAVNGKTGPDIIVQGDAVASFVVPEPGAFLVLGLSSLGLFIRRRK